MPSVPLPSPYTRVLGAQRDCLHPTLQRYFDTIPDGYVGRGEGVFDVVGSRKAWVRLLLRPFQRRGVLFAGWAENVPFRITNRTVAGRAVARREFLFSEGAWVMRDAVSVTPAGRVVDALGDPPLVVASFDLEVSDGALRMVSRDVGITCGRVRLRIPRMLAPTVQLREAYDERTDQQRVSITVDHRLVGRLYEYSGTFTYRIEKAD